MIKSLSTLLIVLLFGPFCLGQSTPTLHDNALLGKEELTTSHPEYTLLPLVAKAFEKMQAAAMKDQIDIKIVSSFRSYTAQKRIWNRKYKRFMQEGYSGEEAIRKIIEYSTLPGTSRHHWGTDIDIIDGSKTVEGDVLLEEHFHGGAYKELHQWLRKNALTFGFDIVYTKDSLRKGFFYEPWHYSYAPLAKDYLKSYQENNMLKKIQRDTTLLGSEFISEQFLLQYEQENILGINPRLKE